MTKCSKCDSEDVNVEEFVCVGWCTYADKITCYECGYIEFVNETEDFE